MMRLKADSKNSQVIRQSMARVLDISEPIITKAFKNIGRASLRYAVTSPDRQWQDYTGNLQDSLGFGIFKNGSLIYWEDLKEKAYEWGNPGGRVPNHDEYPIGAQAALSILNNRTDLFGHGFQLIVVAGMSYAMNVEAINSHKVLTIAMQFTEEHFKEYMRAVA